MLDIEINRTNYALALTTGGAVLKTAPPDDPLPFEEALTTAFLAGFVPVWNKMTKALLASGRLPELVTLSVSKKDQSFDPTFFQQYFEKYFNEVWVEDYRPVTREILEALWEEAQDYAEDTYDGSGDDPESSEAAEESDTLFGFLLDLTVVSILAGTLSSVALPLAQRASFQAAAGERSQDEIEAIFADVLDKQAETTYNHYFSVLAEISATRVRNLGRVITWAQNGATVLQWVTAADERVCGVCEPMHGKTFSVEKAREVLTKLVDASNLEDAIEILPFARRDRDNFVTADGRTISVDTSGDELLALGLGFPPIHGLCRCSIEVLE